MSTSSRRAPAGEARRDAASEQAATPGLQPPQDLTASRFSVGGDEFMLLEWPVPAAAPPACLSPAERRVLELLRAGLSNAAIAAARGSSPRTVANQVASIFQKLGVGSRSELFARLASDPDGTRP